MTRCSGSTTSIFPKTDEPAVSGQLHSVVSLLLLSFFVFLDAGIGSVWVPISAVTLVFCGLPVKKVVLSSSSPPLLFATLVKESHGKNEVATSSTFKFVTPSA